MQDVERPRGIGDNGGPPLEDVFDELRQALPPIFLGSRIDEFTGGAVHWPTTQNRRCKREIPDECFVRSGQRVLVRRDPFLDWWKTTLSDARQKTRTALPQPKAGRKSPCSEAAKASAAGPDQTPASEPMPANRRRRPRRSKAAVEASPGAG
jgi:hypothetical protein